MSLTLQRPRERGIPGWVIAVLIVIGPTLLYLGVAVTGLRAARTNQLKPVTTSDRAHTVTAADVVRTLALQQEVDPQRESWRKILEEDGTLRLVYRFPDLRDPQQKFRVESELVKALDEPSAERSMKVRLSEVNTTFDEKPGLLEGGKAGGLKRDGMPVGSFAIARRGQLVLLVRIEGAFLETPEQTKALLSDKLDNLITFDEPLPVAPK
jgi:hypothetical protein